MGGSEYSFCYIPRARLRDSQISNPIRLLPIPFPSLLSALPVILLSLVRESLLRGIHFVLH
jgi:hypothetical protein